MDNTFHAASAATSIDNAGPDDLVPVTGPGIADPRDTARFNEALGTSAESGTEAVDATGVARAPHTMGDNILSGLQNVSTHMQETWQALGESLDGDMSAGKLLKVQMGLAEMVLQYELVSKAVSRSTQNIDQLVKLQ